MDRKERLRRNIKLLRWFRVFAMALITIPVIVLYYNKHGMDMADVMWLQAIFGATMVVIEVPSGYFSDVLGRRRTMIISAVLISIGWTIYAFAHSFGAFLVGELFLGVGVSFVSGTDAALLYDSLIELNEHHSAVHEEGKRLAIGNFSEAAAAIAGAGLARVSLELPFYLQAVVVFPLIPIAMMLKEPARHTNASTASMRDIWNVVVGVVVHDARLRWMLITASALGASTLTLLWMYQPYWELVGVPIFLFGILWAAGNAAVGVASLRVSWFTKRFGEKGTIGILVASVSIAAGLLGVVPWVWLVPLFAVFYIVRGVSTPIITSRINKRVDSSRRATVLSVRSLGVRVVFIAFAPLIGAAADWWSVPVAFVVTAVVFGLATGTSYIIWRRAVRYGSSTTTGTAL